MGDDADATLGDMIEDVSASSPTEAAIHANRRAAIDERVVAARGQGPADAIRARHDL